MANVFIDDSTMSAIGDAIRAKTGGTDLILPADMATEIAAIETGSNIQLIEGMEIALDFSAGDQSLTAQDGYAVKSATIKKPDNLKAENIKNGVDIAGVVGTLESGGGEGGELVRYVTFLDEDGTQLFKMPVLVGDTCKDPVSHGDISTPTKESTTTQNFTYSGWTSTVGGTVDSSILTNITADKTVYVAYAVSVRYYTVTFYDDDNTTVLNTVQAIYGADVSNYAPIKDGYIFNSWNPSPTNVTADMDCYAVWDEGVTFESASWAKIAEISEAGEAENYFKLGDSKEFTYNGTTYSAIIIGFNLDTLSDGTGNAGITCRFSEAITTSYSTAGQMSYWSTSVLRKNVFIPMIDNVNSDLASVVKSVKKVSREGANYVTVDDEFWEFNTAEIGYDNLPDEGSILYPIFVDGKDFTKNVKWDDLSALGDLYCLRSSSSQQGTYYVGDGKCSERTSVVNKHIPCFCI